MFLYNFTLFIVCLYVCDYQVNGPEAFCAINTETETDLLDGEDFG